MKCHLPPCLLQLIERMQGVILGGAWAQDPMVLLSSCQPTLCTAVHHLLEGGGQQLRLVKHRCPRWYSPPLTAFLPQTAPEQWPRVL